MVTFCGRSKFIRYKELEEGIKIYEEENFFNFKN